MLFFVSEVIVKIFSSLALCYYHFSSVCIHILWSSYKKSNTRSCCYTLIHEIMLPCLPCHAILSNWKISSLHFFPRMYSFYTLFVCLLFFLLIGFFRYVKDKSYVNFDDPSVCLGLLLLSFFAIFESLFAKMSVDSLRCLVNCVSNMWF